MPVRYTTKRRTYRKRTPVKKQVKKAVKKVHKQIFAKKVKQVINRMAEEKTASNFGGVQLIEVFNSTLTPPQSTILDITNALYQIAQGTGQGDRIGNRITLTKFNFKGYVTFASPGATLPIYLKMIVFKQKLDGNNPDMSRMLHNGNTDIAPTNTLRDIIIPLNNDYYTIFATRTFKLGTSTVVTNNDFSLTKFFNINMLKHCKNVVYSDSLTDPTNKKFYVGFLAGYNDGTAVPVSTGIANLNFETIVNYRDL